MLGHTLLSSSVLTRDNIHQDKRQPGLPASRREGMHSLQDQGKHSKWYRPPGETLKVWKYLYYLWNLKFTKQYLKKLDKEIGSYFNPDGTLKEPMKISKEDWYNIKNDIITKKRINQLEALLKNGKMPTNPQDRQDLLSLVKYGRLYDSQHNRYWSNRNKKELFLMHQDYPYELRK